MTELKPCPFCGGEAEILTAESMHGGYLFGIMCNDCCSRGDVYDNEAEAIAAWNTRAAMEFDNWFYLPKPREAIAEIAETLNSFDDEKWTVQQFFKVQEQAVINWAKELDEHIIRRICEVWGRERTCKNEDDDPDAWFKCSECGLHSKLEIMSGGYDIPNYCPNCGAKVVGE